MLKDFEPFKQERGTNCFPTAVRAVLRWYGYDISPDEASAWCLEDPLGCPIEMGIAELSEHLDLSLLGEEAENEIKSRVNDPDEPSPVIVTIRSPLAPPRTLHAVVVIGVGSVLIEGNEDERVFFMDPISGQIEQDGCVSFWQKWDFAGRTALVIDPR